jgi:hypothetical protein
MEESRKRSILLGALVLAVPSVLVLAVTVFIVALLIIKLLWAWVVPDLFPGAVAQGLVAEHISWYTAFKVAIAVAVLGAVAGGHRGKGS